MARVLTDGLSIGDTVTIRLIYKYTNIVAASGRTAKCSIQGSGDVTDWNAGVFNYSPQKTLSGSGEHEFLYSFKITADHLKNSFWSTSIRHDYVQSGSVQWKMFKVEKGNKATDWTPAPEDKADVSHTHPASDITSGTLSSDRLPTVPVSKGGTGLTSLTSGQALIGNGTGTITTRAIDTTSGGTSGSTSLITSGAVYAGLSGKANSSHSHSYLPLSGGTLSGNLYFSNSNGAIAWNSNTYQQRILTTDDSTSDTAVFSFQQSSNSGSNFTDLMVIRDNGKVIANTFVGALSGNADTATTATNLKGFTNTTQSNGATAIDSAIQNGHVYVNGTSSIYSQSDGAAFVQAYNSSWVAQIYQDYRTGQIALRGKNDGTWQSWRKVLDSLNYTSYVPTKTGSGASGTWGISITGNAATTTKASQDASGNTITSSYAASLSVSGRTLTLKSKSGATLSTVTTQDTTYSAGTGISISGTTITNSGVRSVATGDTIGGLLVNTNGTITNVGINGIGSTDISTIGDGTITGAISELNTNLLEKVYPIGSIYISVNSTNPATLFGGTWERFGIGKVLVGVDEYDTDFKTANKVGGEKTHKLTVSEMPSHSHDNVYHNSAWTGTYIPSNDINSAEYGAWGKANLRAGDGGTVKTGGGNAHNNLPPYITCYMWKRTA